MEDSTKPVAGDEQGIVEDDSKSGTSLTRRKALGVGAVALGGAALASRAQAGTVRASVSGTTQLSAAAAQGAHVLAVKSTTGFALGFTIWIDVGGNIESAVISGVNATTLKLTVNANLQHAHNTGARVSIIPPAVQNPNTFKTVLTQLANDPAYRAAAIAQPGRITTDFPQISLLELSALRDVAILSGADINAINVARAAVISGSTGSPGTITIGGLGSLGWSISCCSCCCCCCGETAVLVR